MAAYYSLAALGLCLFMGYAGQVSLGHAGFLAIGGYASAAVSTANLLPLAASPVVAALAAAGLATRGVDLYGAEALRLSPWLGPLAGLLLAAAAAVLLGLPSLRLRGHYLAMATLSFGIIVHRIVVGSPALGSADGIPEIPALRIAEGLAVSGRKALRVPNYYLAWALVTLALLAVLNLARSRAGRSRCAPSTATKRPPPRSGWTSDAPSSPPSWRAPCSPRSRGRCSRTTTAASAPGRRR